MGARTIKVREVFARNLNVLCRRYGNYSEVARQLGITRQQLRKHLQAESLPTERTLARMSRFFKVEETDLVDPDFRAETSSRAHRYATEIVSALSRTDPPDLPEGWFDLYFSFPNEPDALLRALVLTRHVESTVEFRRITSFYRRDRSDWRFFRGDHRGIAVQAADAVYLCGVNRLPTFEPSIVALKKQATSVPLYHGHSMVMNVDGGTVAAAVMTRCPASSLREALQRPRTMAASDDEAPPIVRQEMVRMRAMLGQ